MKCVTCGERAVIDLRRHNCGFCRGHFFEYFQRQVQRCIKDFSMLNPRDRILVAVSGGKDSLVLWDVLLELGYAADGLHVNLGIGDYSQKSSHQSRNFADSRRGRLIESSMLDDYEYSLGQVSRALHRPPCSLCGLGKRYILNREALQGGYSVLATGHNLDDEAAVLFGNLLHWSLDSVGRQFPVLEEQSEGHVRKVKPLVRLSERETAAYAVLKGIDYVTEECPMARGARSILYKDVLNRLEQKSPGAKFSFLFGYFERGRTCFGSGLAEPLRECLECGQPTTRTVCAFCRARNAGRSGA